MANLLKPKQYPTNSLEKTALLKEFDKHWTTLTHYRYKECWQQRGSAKITHLPIWLDIIDYNINPRNQILAVLMAVSDRTTVPCQNPISSRQALTYLTYLMDMQKTR